MSGEDDRPKDGAQAAGLSTTVQGSIIAANAVGPGGQAHGTIDVHHHGLSFSEAERLFGLLFDQSFPRLGETTRAEAGAEETNSQQLSRGLPLLNGRPKNNLRGIKQRRADQRSNCTGAASASERVKPGAIDRARSLALAAPKVVLNWAMDPTLSDSV